MNNINTSVLPVVKSEWQNQLNVLRLANETANNTVTSIQRQINKDAGLVSTLKPQLEKAQLSQWEAAQKYNSFIESGSQLLKVASDAEARLKNNNLSLFDRSQLVITRDNMINLASEFITFKSKNGASLQSLGPMNIGPKTYYSDGRVEWNTGLTSGMAGKVIENTGKVFTGIKEALLKGPLTTEENYAACQSALNELLPTLAGKVLKSPGGGLSEIAYGEVLDNAINAADPAGAMCRRVYPKGQSPQELWRLGQVIEGTDSLGGAWTVVLIEPSKLSAAILHEVFTDPQVQGLWSSEQATDAITSLTGQNWTPFLDTPDTQSDISALSVVWSNPQWSIQLASAGGIMQSSESGPSMVQTRIDSNADGKWDQIDVATDTNHDGNADSFISTGSSQYSLFNADKQMDALHDKGLLSTDFWNDYTSWSTSRLVETNLFSLNYNQPIYTPGLSPIGAFYENKSAANDPATSIANKTLRILGSTNQALTASQLGALDANKDSQLSAAELNGLNAWVDSNEDGVGQSTELTTLAAALANAGLSSIRASDYAFYTAGNASLRTVAQSTATAPVNALVAPTAMDSNYATLRATDNRFNINAFMWIDWTASQVKLSSNQQNLVGTEGNDSFDIGYYQAYNGTYFNLNLVQNFYAGGGHDVMGGSIRNDNLWGGTGNDVLFGYAGDDKLYGEEGSDELQGGAGNDLLNGAVGDDKLFGQVGNDTLVGGDGADIMMGFTASNDTKQTLAAGETDDDTMFGGAGADQMWGGLGNDTMDGGADNDLVMGGDGNDTLFSAAGDDELNGGAGADILDGGIGADKLFGGVGNDQMWGGIGADIMLGFTPSNDTKQTLAAGETDNDVMYGGAGDDLMLGGLGDDHMWGGVGADELQGGIGNDALYGEDGNDRLFGGAGNDTMYGGNGDDLLFGGAASNEAALASGTEDSNYLYGGAGNDTIVGGIGNDYIDGGAGADNMQGGKGDDSYTVNSVNDVILEQASEGYDTVTSSSNYILNANIEELRLVEGFTINGTGNSLNNRIIGNSQDNILDGVTGADTTMGGLGNDTYYVDNLGDQVIEYAAEGTDTVNASISHALGAHVENLTLLDFSKAEKGIADGTNILVYGYPKAFELDYMQGNAVAGYKGTCALTSIANLATQANQALTEAQVVQRAIDNQWAVTSSTATDYQRGGSNYIGQQALLNSYGIRNGIVMGYNEQAMANLIKGGRGVIIAVNAGKLWGDSAYLDNGGVNHVVTVTGVACDAATGAINGFYIADSGRGLVSDMTRYIAIADFRSQANVANAYSIYTIDPIKLWEENINATGNELANVITGNRGDNVIKGGLGNDTLTGQAGNDVYQFAKGDGQDTIVESDATLGNADVLQLANINQTNLWFKHVGNDLQINVLGTTDQILVKDWYVAGTTGSDNQIERIKTADGLTIYNTDVETFVQAMAAFAPPSAAQTSWTSGQSSNGKVLLAVSH